MRLFIFPFLLLFLIGCGTNSNPPALSDGMFGLESSVPATNTLTLNSKNNLLWAGTNQGAYKKTLGTTGQGWQPAGLDVDSTEVIDFAIVNNQEVWAVIKYDNVDPQNAMLFKTMNQGGSWNPDFSTEIPPVNQFAISEVELDPNNPERLFVYRAHVIRSEDKGQTWSVSFDDGFAPAFLNLSDEHPAQVWAGGNTNILSPYLAKSADGGESWSLLNREFNYGETTIHDIAVHPQKAVVVLAGTQGLVTNSVIRRSTNGGQSWETVLEEVGTLTLAHSAQTPGRVYGSGISIEGRLFFVASRDFGKSWETVTMEGGPVGILVNDMISVMEDEQEVLYFATDQGVYSYTFEE